MNILVINAGSSSLKYQLLNPETGALLAKAVARRVRDVDYPLLIASAYSGFVIWHVRPVGSIPLQIGGTAPRCLELYTRPRLLPLYFTR
mgnify:CR=1 FL=1